jgi:hypothetical protein
MASHRKTRSEKRCQGGIRPYEHQLAGLSRGVGRKDCPKGGWFGRSRLSLKYAQMHFAQRLASDPQPDAIVHRANFLAGEGGPDVALEQLK